MSKGFESGLHSFDCDHVLPVHRKTELKALIITGKRVQDHEFIVPFYRLQEAGYEVDIAVRGKQPCLAELGAKIEPTKDIDELEIVDYEVLILPGGAKCLEYIRQDQGIIDFIREFHVAGKVVAAICHGSQLLISAGLVRGRNISGYYSIKDDIENAGGHYLDVPAVVFDRIVTSPHYKHLGQWMGAVLATIQQEKEWRKTL